MSNKLFIFSAILLVPCICYFCAAQTTNSSIAGLRLQYESLQFEETISRAGRLLESGQHSSPNELIAIHEYMALSYYNLGDIDSSKSHFLSILSIDERYEPDPVNISPKIIEFYNQLQQDHQTDISRSQAIPYTKYVFEEDRRRSAMFRSAVLPGWGQMHKLQKTKGYIIGGLFFSSLIATGVSLYFEKDYRNKYLDSSTPESIEANYQKYDDWYKRRQVFTTTTILMWAVGVLDALIIPYPQIQFSFTREAEYFLSCGFSLR